LGISKTGLLFKHDRHHVSSENTTVMLTGLPSLEVALLAVWKLMIILAIAAFLCILAIRIWKPIRRLARKLFRTARRRRIPQSSFENPSAFAHAPRRQTEAF
jgi:hypothetical protein